MNTSVEISMYPLNADYEKPILAFIDKLKANAGLQVEMNGMSTQIFGEYDVVMNAVKACMKSTFLEEGKVVFVIKVLNGTAKLD